jgi:hypothetical protein
MNATAACSYPDSHRRTRIRIPVQRSASVFTKDSQADHAYTVENSSAAAFALVRGAAPADYAATLTLDQSGSILETDPTNARLVSAIDGGGSPITVPFIVGIP